MSSNSNTISDNEEIASDVLSPNNTCFIMIDSVTLFFRLGKPLSPYLLFETLHLFPSSPSLPQEVRSVQWDTVQCPMGDKNVLAELRGKTQEKENYRKERDKK